VDVVLRVPITSVQGEATRRLPQRLLHQPGRQANPDAIHPRSGLLEDLTGFLVMYFQAGVLQHVENAQEELLQLIVGEHVEAHT
jgi:hypothetical protein